MMLSEACNIICYNKSACILPNKGTSFTQNQCINKYIQPFFI